MNRTLLVTLVSSHVFVACSSSRVATPEEADDAAQAIGLMVSGGGGGDVTAMIDAVQIARGSTPRGLRQMPDGHVHGHRVNVDFSYMVVCKNAAGAVLMPCDRTTNEAMVDIAWSGSVSTPSFDAMMNRVGTWVLSGLLSEVATFSGASTFSSSATLRPSFRSGVTKTYEFDTAAAYDAIEIIVADPRPIGGFAIFDVSARHTVAGTAHDIDASFTVHAELTFFADHTATLVIDGTRHYRIDLDTGRIIGVD